MIQLEKFQSGVWQKSTTGYSFFVPEKINADWVWSDQGLNDLLEKAAIRLGELNAFAKLVPNIDLFIRLHVTKEAVVSSRIEGTVTNMDEALMHESEVSPERRNDWKEVNNYIHALNSAIEEMENLPLSSRLMKAAHLLLMDNVRGEHKQPGEFRRSQNWIGGSSPADAVFVPPAHSHVESLMGDLENFLHNDDIKVPALVRIGIAHYQFETIHPFLDGNGRIGRLLITLFLVDKGIMARPLLYLSTYFEKKKSLYYDTLTNVRIKGDMLQWLKYFLVGVADTAKQAAEALSSVLALKADLEARIHSSFGRKSNSANMLLLHLFREPIVDVQDVKGATGLSYKAANDLVNDFIGAGILREMTGQSRNRLFSFDKYLALF